VKPETKDKYGLSASASLTKVVLRISNNWTQCVRLTRLG